MNDVNRNNSRLNKEYATESENKKLFFLFGNENSVNSDRSNDLKDSNDTIIILLYHKLRLRSF